MFEVPAQAAAEAFARRLAAMPGVRYAEPNYAVRQLVTPTDPDFDSQWNMNRIGAPAAWDVTRAAGVTVAVIDTGVDIQHPEFTGRIDTVNDYDFVNGDSTAQDDGGHGTHVAGIIGAALNNTNTGPRGVVGVANLCTILPIKVLDAAGDGSWDMVADGVRWAADRGADVINLSLGSDEYSETLNEAVQYAVARDVVVVAATGNEADYGVLYPARLANVIGVGSITSLDERSSFSNYGPGTDLCAPGSSIYSTWWNGGSTYGFGSGTSMATPHVAGVAALVRAVNPTWTRTQVEAQLIGSARDLGAAGRDDSFGHGLVQAAEAVGVRIPLGALAGVVTDIGGDGLAAVSVDVPGYPRVVTAADGRYACSGLAPGTHTVTYSLNGYRSQTQQVTIAEDATTTRDVSLAPDVNDSTPPRVVSLSLSRDAVDTGSSSQTVVATMRVRDDSSGFSGGFISIASPSGASSLYGSLVRLSGSAIDGTYSAEVTLPRYAEAGAWALSVTGFDAIGNLMAYRSGDLGALGFPSTLSVTPDYVPLKVVNISGTSRYATAVKASELAFPDGAASVVIATGANWPDALGGSALAGALDAPILLTRPEALLTEVRNEIVRLGATHAIILGGAGAVSDAVYREIDAIPGMDLERIAGTSRYATANAVAARTIGELGAAFDGTAFVATGANFPDALGASPIAAANGWPIYLANPTQGGNAAMVSSMSAAGVTEAVILGGTGAASSAVETSLKVLGPVTRLAGASRYDTAVQVASYGVYYGGLGYDRLAIATGENFPDALAGGVLQARSGSVLLLTPTASLNPGVAASLRANKAAIFEVRYIGGEGALSDAVRMGVAEAVAK